ncbi:hypothetical protein GN958_ATG02969 [Phytophthora infestans]|uniref:Uncharacterized protein n=1 Tax=Phytophthora infestans TaxID=4787 RepID=A0A8S9V300_PHYIN|nr:hypothetical protein GN958_ATG02969 [Phytophthora infestans]
MPLDTDDMLEIPDDDNDSASLASYDSEEFGLIAGKGFARMAEHVNVVEVARQKAAIPSAMRRTSSLWNRFLLDDELIKMGGLISKRKGLFSKVTKIPRKRLHKQAGLYSMQVDSTIFTALSRCQRIVKFEKKIKVNPKTSLRVFRVDMKAVWT